MTFSFSWFSVSRNIITLLLALLTSLSMGQVQAITINFDDLNPQDFIDIENPDAGPTPLSNQYESLGVMFEDGAYLIGGSSKSLPNYVAGPGFTFHFLGALPTYVSMYVGSETEYQVSVSAYGVNCFLGHVITDGLVTGMGSNVSTPYRDNQFVSFFAPDGISYIHLTGQADAYMDDLSFGVPEPGIYILFCLGILSIYLQRKYC